MAKARRLMNWRRSSPLVRRRSPCRGDDAAKEVGDEVALRLGASGEGTGRGPAGDVERAEHAAETAGRRGCPLRAAGEVDAAEDGRLLEGVGLEERAHEVAQRIAQRLELEGEVEDRAPRFGLALAIDGADGAGVERLSQVVELALEALGGTLLRRGRRGEGDAPDLGALALAEVVPELHEPRPRGPSW